MILIVLRNSDSILSCYMSKIKTGFLYTFEVLCLILVMNKRRDSKNHPGLFICMCVFDILHDILKRRLKLFITCAITTQQKTICGKGTNQSFKTATIPSPIQMNV